MALPVAKAAMLTLARGSFSLDHTRGQGFTLIELLVVLVVMGIALGMATVQLMPDDHSRLQQAGQQLALLLENAGLEARSSGVAMAWVTEGNQYQFLQRNAQGIWESIDSGSFRSRALGEGIAITAVALDGKTLNPGNRMVLSATSFALPFEVRLNAGAATLFVIGNSTGAVSVTPDRGANETLITN